jgi:hypothetical protein
VIIGPEGLAREIELCESHGGPVANAYALARPVASRAVARVKATRPVNRPPAELPEVVREPEPNWR